MIKEIHFIPVDHENSELVNQFDVLAIWEILVKRKNSLDVIYLDYEIDD